MPCRCGAGPCAPWTIPDEGPETAPPVPQRSPRSLRAAVAGSSPSFSVHQLTLGAHVVCVHVSVRVAETDRRRVFLFCVRSDPPDRRCSPHQRVQLAGCKTILEWSRLEVNVKREKTHRQGAALRARHIQARQLRAVPNEGGSCLERGDRRWGLSWEWGVLPRPVPCHGVCVAGVRVLYCSTPSGPCSCQGGAEKPPGPELVLSGGA